MYRGPDEWQALGVGNSKLGFLRMATAMAIFKNQAQAIANGVLVDED